eukprot:TRINITY_DN21478_c0_g1_i1.p1 TRINITY_DN21478_c0_g1~~TRINITY_DN21478_c0_g1_i1.p1  ORF type:complete len:105 (-),score=10.50 TRINITY_DN21478_c0_g1_i1:11-325(-)
MSEAFYGIALCFLKQGRYRAALANIEHAIKLVTRNMKYYKYLKAVCHKQLEEFEAASRCYHEVCNGLIAKAEVKPVSYLLYLSLIHICRCRRYAVCRSRWSPYH